MDQILHLEWYPYLKILICVNFHKSLGHVYMTDHRN